MMTTIDRLLSRKTVGVRLALGLAAAVAASVPWSIAAQGEPRLFLSLTNPDGSPVVDLKNTEVALRQGSSTCVWVRLTPVTWPTRLTVLVDNGTGMDDALADLRSGLRAFFAQLPPGIEMSIVTTAPQPRFVVRPTTNRDALTKGVDLIAPDRGASKFIDAVMEAVDRIERDKTDNFPMMVAVSNTVVEGSGAKEQDLERMFHKLEGHPVTIHVVLLGDSITATQAGQLGALLTKSTGGVLNAINSNSTSRLVTLLPEVAQRVLHSYDRQSHQYRVSCDRWEGPVAQDKPFSLGTTRRGVTGVSSADGHLP